jgi:hypothetical protein
MSKYSRLGRNESILSHYHSPYDARYIRESRENREQNHPYEKCVLCGQTNCDLMWYDNTGIDKICLDCHFMREAQEKGTCQKCGKTGEPGSLHECQRQRQMLCLDCYEDECIDEINKQTRIINKIDKGDTNV